MEDREKKRNKENQLIHRETKKTNLFEIKIETCWSKK